jgi:hypothetical protein
MRLVGSFGRVKVEQESGDKEQGIGTTPPTKAEASKKEKESGNKMPGSDVSSIAFP